MIFTSVWCSCIHVPFSKPLLHANTFMQSVSLNGQRFFFRKLFKQKKKLAIICNYSMVTINHEVLFPDIEHVRILSIISSFPYMKLTEQFWNSKSIENKYRTIIQMHTNTIVVFYPPWFIRVLNRWNDNECLMTLKNNNHTNMNRHNINGLLWKTRWLSYSKFTSMNRVNQNYTLLSLIASIC